MNQFGFFLTALLASAAPAEEKAPSRIVSEERSREQMGEETLQDIRKDYLQGKYAPFLKELDDAYQTAKNSASFAQFLEMRKIAIPSAEDQKWKTLFAAWKVDRDQTLLRICSPEDQSIYSKKIASIASDLSDEEEAALEYLATYQFLLPGDGANAEENIIIDLDIEYEFKRIHLDSYAALTSNNSFQELRLQQDVLKMEEMDKLLKASSQFQDTALKEIISKAAHSLDSRLAKIRDSFDLYALLNQTERTAQEERLATILSAYQTKYSDLYKELILGE